MFQQIMCAEVATVVRKIFYNAYNEHSPCTYTYIVMCTRRSQTHMQRLQRQSCEALEGVAPLAKALADAS